MLKLARIFLGVAFGVALVVGWYVVPPLWYSVPWRIRWWTGESAFLALIAGCVFLCFRYLPRTPWPLIDRATRPQPKLDQVVALVLWSIGLSMAYPLLSKGDDWGALGDWDLHLQWYEALRKSILEYGQFPWWNPWSCGGWLLAAEPQFGLVSIDTPLVLIFGTKLGLKIALVADLLFALEGARRLAMLWFRSPWAVAAATAVYTWNGAIVIAAIGNRALPMSYPFLPWMLLFAFQIQRGVGNAIGLGVVTAISVLYVIQYPTFYAMLITTVVLIWGLWTQPDRPSRLRYLRHLWIAAGLFLTIAGWRLALSGLVFLDFPRKISSRVDFTIGNYLNAFIHRSIPPADIYRSTFNLTSDWFPELASYVGWFVVTASFFGLIRGWRWWHTLTVICFLLAWGGVRLYHPSYWMGEWPIFSSMHVVSRWRLPAMLGIAFAVAQGIERSERETSRIQIIKACLSLMVMLDLGAFALQCLPSAFSVPAVDVHFPDDETGSIVNLAEWEPNGNTQTYECLTRGYGVIQGYCPQLGYDRDRRTLRLWRGHSRYLGEAWSKGQAIAPVEWSPNRIVFLGWPHETITINQNPGSWWWVNGRQEFRHARCAEINLPFVAQTDERGRLILEIHPQGLGLAAGFTSAGVLISITGLFVRKRRPQSLAASESAQLRI